MGGHIGPTRAKVLVIQVDWAAYFTEFRKNFSIYEAVNRGNPCIL